jgi:hypothetical protein
MFTTEDTEEHGVANRTNQFCRVAVANNEW